MDETNNDDDFLLPGFRFHPTDEELVEFYLKRKLEQQHPLPFELIKQVDIYKYDPWDLPKLASIGEKEWYFYCPRDRKYKNSARPNRVTVSGFWKATGTDRPIYSSFGMKCIGLKKSLVFYRGRAAKCMKTDWMMHEFRLASTSVQTKNILDKDVPTSDSLAICRIFRKTVSMVHRPLSCPNDIQFSSEIELPQDNMFTLNIPSCKPSLFAFPDSKHFPGKYHFSAPGEVSGMTNESTTDLSPMLLNLSPADKTSGFLELAGPQQFINGFPANSVQVMQEIVNIEDEVPLAESNSWKPPNLPWDSPQCP